jgi:hypothetical protein
MQTFNFELPAANSTVLMDTLVGYVRYYEKTIGAGERIIVQSFSGSGYRAELLPGEALRLPVAERGLIVVNASGAALSGKLLIGATPDGSFQTDRAIGNVNVTGSTIDAKENATINSTGFLVVAQIGPFNCTIHAFNVRSTIRALLIRRVVVQCVTGSPITWVYGGQAAAFGAPVAIPINYRRTQATAIPADLAAAHNPEYSFSPAQILSTPIVVAAGVAEQIIGESQAPIVVPANQPFVLIGTKPVVATDVINIRFEFDAL